MLEMLDAYARMPKASGPVTLRAGYLRAIERWDFSLVMAAFDFDVVFAKQRTFLVEGVPIKVARLSDIVASKAAAGREKDRLFLASHAEALRCLIDDETQE